MTFLEGDPPTREQMVLAVCEAARQLINDDPATYSIDGTVTGKPNRAALLAMFSQANGIAGFVSSGRILAAAQALQRMADEDEAMRIIEEGIDEAATRQRPAR